MSNTNEPRAGPKSAGGAFDKKLTELIRSSVPGMCQQPTLAVLLAGWSSVAALVAWGLPSSGFWGGDLAAWPTQAVCSKISAFSGFQHLYLL
jgi:hypothetical protein